jgi:hypothetical protein
LKEFKFFYEASNLTKFKAIEFLYKVRPGILVIPNKDSPSREEELIEYCIQNSIPFIEAYKTKINFLFLLQGFIFQIIYFQQINKLFLSYVSNIFPILQSYCHIYVTSNEDQLHTNQAQLFLRKKNIFTVNIAHGGIYPHKIYSNIFIAYLPIFLNFIRMNEAQKNILLHDRYPIYYQPFKKLSKISYLDTPHCKEYPLRNRRDAVNMMFELSSACDIQIDIILHPIDSIENFIETFELKEKLLLNNNISVTKNHLNNEQLCISSATTAFLSKLEKSIACIFFDPEKIVYKNFPLFHAFQDFTYNDSKSIVNLIVNMSNNSNLFDNYQKAYFDHQLNLRKHPQFFSTNEIINKIIQSL